MTEPKRTRVKRDSSPQAIESRMLEAHKRSTPVDVQYDEVPALIDVALNRVRQHAAESAAAVRGLARTFKATVPPPAPPEGKPA